MVISPHKVGEKNNNKTRGRGVGGEKKPETIAERTVCINVGFPTYLFSVLTVIVPI